MNQVVNQVWYKVRSQVWNQVLDQVRLQVMAQVWTQVNNYIIWGG
jgi:hypothetical protein